MRRAHPISYIQQTTFHHMKTPHNQFLETFEKITIVASHEEGSYYIDQIKQLNKLKELQEFLETIVNGNLKLSIHDICHILKCTAKLNRIDLVNEIYIKLNLKKITHISIYNLMLEILKKSMNIDFSYHDVYLQAISEIKFDSDTHKNMLNIMLKSNHIKMDLVKNIYETAEKYKQLNTSLMILILDLMVNAKEKNSTIAFDCIFKLQSENKMNKNAYLIMLRIYAEDIRVDIETLYSYFNEAKMHGFADEALYKVMMNAIYFRDNQNISLILGLINEVLLNGTDKTIEFDNYLLSLLVAMNHPSFITASKIFNSAKEKINVFNQNSVTVYFLYENMLKIILKNEACDVTFAAKIFNEVWYRNFFHHEVEFTKIGSLYETMLKIIERSDDLNALWVENIFVEVCKRNLLTHSLCQSFLTLFAVCNIAEDEKNQFANMTLRACKSVLSAVPDTVNVINNMEYLLITYEDLFHLPRINASELKLNFKDCSYGVAYFYLKAKFNQWLKKPSDELKMHITYSDGISDESKYTVKMAIGKVITEMQPHMNLGIYQGQPNEIYLRCQRKIFTQNNVQTQFRHQSQPNDFGKDNNIRKVKPQSSMKFNVHAKSFEPRK